MPAPLPIASLSSLRVGQATFAIGSPFGFQQTLTTGVISSLTRRIVTPGGSEIDAIQTDAAINPGNSGGPLLDSAGRLIGVNTQFANPTGTGAFIGIGLAVPVDVVNRVVQLLIRDGKVPIPSIGIVPLEDIVAAQADIDGVVILRVFAKSPAERAGLRGIDVKAKAVGDIIVGANNQPVRRFADLAEQLEAVGLGNRIQLTILRGKNRGTVPVDVVDATELDLVTPAAAPSPGPTPPAPGPKSPAPKGKGPATPKGTGLNPTPGGPGR
jgi:2-alkenal reductase